MKRLPIRRSGTKWTEWVIIKAIRDGYDDSPIFSVTINLRFATKNSNGSIEEKGPWISHRVHLGDVKDPKQKRLMRITSWRHKEGIKHELQTLAKAIKGYVRRSLRNNGTTIETLELDQIVRKTCLLEEDEDEKENAVA